MGVFLDSYPERIHGLSPAMQITILLNMIHRPKEFRVKTMRFETFFKAIKDAECNQTIQGAEFILGDIDYSFDFLYVHSTA